MSSRILSALLLVFVISKPATDFQQASYNENIGILILAHGSQNPEWNNTLKDVTNSLSESYPLEIAFGMANPYSMQPAIDKLEDQGVSTIVAVQLFVSSFSPIIRQNEFLLGLRDSLADAPMQPMRHEMTDEMMAMMDHSDHFEIKPLEINSNVLITQPLDDHPLIAEILMERVHAVSENPEKETLLLVAHGPVKDSDNEQWVSKLESIADQIKDLHATNGGAEFFNIISMTVRDDASDDVYNAAKNEFRAHIQEADEVGDAIVIPVLMSKGGVEHRYLTRLEGLNYKWTGETILPHNNVAEFIKLSVDNALKGIAEL